MIINTSGAIVEKKFQQVYQGHLNMAVLGRDGSIAQFLFQVDTSPYHRPFPGVPTRLLVWNKSRQLLLYYCPAIPAQSNLSAEQNLLLNMLADGINAVMPAIFFSADRDRWDKYPSSLSYSVLLPKRLEVLPESEAVVERLYQQGILVFNKLNF